MSGKLDGRVAIVTGASRGIGRAIAAMFAAEGAKVVAAARTVESGDHPLPGSIAETVAEIKDAGGEATAVRCDVSDQDDLANLVAEARRLYGPVSVLVNNAALTYYIPLKDFPLKRWQKMIDVDLTAPFLLIQAVLPDMLESDGGHILNISSIAAQHPAPPYQFPAHGGTVYGIVKAGIERLSSGLAHELLDTGVVVNALSPTGIVGTPGVLYHKLIESEDDPRAEPVDYMAKAALVLVTGDQSGYHGRLLYSQDVLREQGLL